LGLDGAQRHRPHGLVRGERHSGEERDGEDGGWRRDLRASHGREAPPGAAAAISHRSVQNLLMLTLDTFVHARHGKD